MKANTLRVCLVTLDSPYFHRLDGVAVYTYLLSKNLARLGCEVHVFGVSKNVDKKAVFIQEGVTFHCLPDTKAEWKPSRFLLFLKRMTKAISTQLQDQRFDVIHGQGMCAGAVALAEHLGLKSRYVATIHTVGYDEQIVTTQDYWKSGFYLTSLCNLLMPLPMVKLYGNLVYNKMDMNISISEYNKHRASLVYNIPLDRIITIPPVIDDALFDVPLRSDSSQSDRPLLLYVGRLAPRKGVQFLVRAMPKIVERFPKINLTIVGRGSFEGYLRDLARELGMQDFITFLGFVERKELHKIYASAEVVALPSLFEGVPQVLFEAMAAGKPVIASAVQGIPEIIKHGFSGLLVKPGSVSSIVNAVTLSLADRNLAKQLGRNARQTISKDYTGKAIARKILAVYERL